MPLPNILIIDPNELQSPPVRAVIAAAGGEAVYASSVRHLPEGNFDLVLLHCCSPDPDPAGITELTRTHPRAPIIAILDQPDSTGMIAAYHAGAFDVLPITASVTDLAGAVRRGLDRRRLLEQSDPQVPVGGKKPESGAAGIANGVIVVGQDGRILQINPPARELLFLEDADQIGSPFDEVVDLPDLIETVYDDEQTTIRRIEVDPAQGHFLRAEVSLLPGTGKKITLQDVSQYRTLDKVKNDFIANISHDLRSPLTAILGYIELIERVGETNPQQHEFIQRVQQSVHNITELIDALLDLGRIESDYQSTRNLVSLTPVILSAAEAFGERFIEKNQDVTIDIEPGLPDVYGLPARLRQLVGNLLENANKYTPPGGRIQVLARAEGRQVILQVCDNGIGIPPSEMPFIFDKLYRGSNVPGDSEGTGLGLSIVRSIVENHGGRYWCESKPGEGTTMTVVLPGPAADQD